MQEVIHRNHYDVTDKVFLGDPRPVCGTVCALLREVNPEVNASRITRAFDTFGRLYAGALPGYSGCETWYHDAQHSLDSALAMARLMHGHERSVPPPQRLGARRLALGVIAALFHDAGYIRNAADPERHGAEFTLFHVARSGEFIAQLLHQYGADEDAALAQQLVHFTGYELPLERIGVAHPLDRRLGFMLGSADVLAQMSDRCYLEKCRDFLFAEFELCGLAGSSPECAQPTLYPTPEYLLQHTPEFRERLWRERMDGYFEGVHHYAAQHFGGINLYTAAIDSHLGRLRRALGVNNIRDTLTRRAEAINAGPLRRILGFHSRSEAHARAMTRPPRRHERRAGSAAPLAYVPT
jgi:hypothetical protein